MHYIMLHNHTHYVNVAVIKTSHMHVTVLRDNNYYCNNLIIENYTKVIFIFKGLVAQETEVVHQHEHQVLKG